MTPEKKQRLTNAVGFLSGVITSLDAVRDAKVFWPPPELWEGLRNVHRVEFGGGIALIAVTIVLTIVRKRAD